MAKNGPKGGGRRGAVKQRSQFRHNGVWFKRDTRTGRIMNGKEGGDPHKGVREEGSQPQCLSVILLSREGIALA